MQSSDYKVCQVMASSSSSSAAAGAPLSIESLLVLLSTLVDRHAPPLLVSLDHLHQKVDSLCDNVEDRFDHLHQKVDSLRDDVEERFTSLEMSVSTVGSLSLPTKPPSVPFSTLGASGPPLVLPDGGTPLSAPPISSPYGTCIICRGGPAGISSSSTSGHATTSRYPPITPPTGSGGGLSRPLPGSAPSLHERSGAGPVQWMCTSKGPYLGGIPKTFKTLSLTLDSDDFDAFFRFYNGLVTQLVVAGYHRRLLPSLDYIAPDVDLSRSPVLASCMPLDGDHSSLEWAQSTYWDSLHHQLSQLLYLSLTAKDVIKSTAPFTLSVLARFSQHSDGFGVLQTLLRRHHPRVDMSCAPSYDMCLSVRPTFRSARESHSLYLSMYERWMDRIRLHYEFGVTHRLSQFSIWFIQGLSPPLRAQLRDQEQILIRFQAQFRSSKEPDLLPETAVAELGELLSLFAPEQSSSSLVPTSPSGGPSGTIAAVDLSSVSIYEHYVAAFGGGKRPSRSALPSAPCANAPCRGRSHPPDLCCICYAPHSWEKCWHLVGLPDREMTRCKEFQSLSARGDAKSAAGSLGAHIASLPGTCSTTSNDPATPFADPIPPPPGIPVVDSDVDDVHRSMLLQEGGYILNHRPSVFSLVAPSDDALAIWVATPSDAPDSITVDEDILLTVPLDDPDPIPPIPASIGVEPSVPPPPGHVWWHVDSGATGFCTNRLSDLLASIPTNLSMGTADQLATSTIEAMGSISLSGIDRHGHHFHQPISQVFGVPSFARRSFSLHGLRSLGYTCIHSAGEYLRLSHQPTGVEYDFPVYTLHGNAH